MPAFFPITARPFHPVKVPVSTGWHPVAASKQRLQAPQAWAKVWNLGGKREDRTPTVADPIPYTDLIVGVPKETCDGESRVALTPTDVAALVEKGISVNIEQGAGALSDFSDEQYKAAGAAIVNATKAFQSQIVLKVQPPNTVYETAKFKKGSTLMSWIQPESHERLLTRLQEKQMTVISMECLPSGLLRSTMRDTKASLGKLSGYQAVVEAINYFPRFFTGKAKGRSLPLAESLKISDIGSISPAKVLVIGGGAAGLSAAAAAKSMGASVRVYGRDASVREKVESIGALFLDVDANSSGTWEVSGEGEFDELCSAEAELFKRQAEEVDIIISDVRVSGQPAPKLISKAMIESMSAGCVTVDLAAEAGGNIETTVTDDVFVTSNGVTCVGYTDMLAKMGAKGSAMFSTNISQFLLSMGPFTGYEQQFYIDGSDPAVSQSTVLLDGVIVWGNEAAEASAQSTTSSSSASAAGSTTGSVGVPFKTAADAQLEAQRAASSATGASSTSSEASITSASDTRTAGSTTSPSTTSPEGSTSSGSTTSAAGSTAGASSSSTAGSTTEPVRAPFKTAADAKLEAQRAAESSQQTSFTWKVGGKLPAGSQTADGTVLPANAEPQADGTVLIPGMASIRWGDVTLPDGIKLSSILAAGSKTPEPVAFMPDGSRPSQRVGFGWSTNVNKSAVPDLSGLQRASFNWKIGAKLPKGSQRADGTVIPSNAVPQPDGTVIILGMASLAWDEVTLPDGIKLSSILVPNGSPLTPEALMPSGSRPSQPVGFSWSENVTNMSALELPEFEIPSFKWTVGAKLPPGSQRSDGTVLPDNAEPQPDGTVLIPGIASIRWDEVTLPDGVKLDVLLLSGDNEEPTPEKTMPDGSDPSPRIAWAGSVYRKPSMPVIGMLGFVAGAISSASDALSGKPSGSSASSKAAVPQAKADSGRKQQQKAVLGGAKKSTANTTLPKFNWTVGSTLPPGSQKSDGTVLPAGAEPQPDGTVLIPGKASIKWEDVTLPDGMKLMSILLPSGKSVTAETRMPDGSKPAKPVGFGWAWNVAQLSFSDLPDIQKSAFTWKVGAKLPEGSQKADGTVLPGYSLPQPDGTVLIPGMGSIKWEEVTLPDGINLMSLLMATHKIPAPGAFMPDGSSPSQSVGFGWSSIIENFSAADIAATPRPEFNWMVGTKLPPGSQTADGKMVPTNAEPQPDGTVLIPGMASIKWEEVTLPDGIRLDGFLKPSSAAPKTQGKMPDGSDPAIEGSWIAALLRKPTVPVDLLSSKAEAPSHSKPAEVLSTFNWIVGAKLPPGSQKSDGTVLPAGSEPQPDGTVLIPGMPSIKWADVTLPDGIRLDGFVDASSTAPQTQGKMPDGSNPVEEGSWISSLLNKVATAGASFNWIVGTKLPAGSQTADGAVLPAGSEPQPDGTVLIPGMPSIKWEEVTLPDSIRLDGFLKPSSTAPKPQGKMPDGSAPAIEGSWVASLLRKPTAPVNLLSSKPEAPSPAQTAESSPSKPEDPVPSFNWIVGTKLPSGSQKADGTVLLGNAEPQPDGMVLIPGMASIRWEEVTLPDGIRLDSFIRPSGAAPETQGKMPDGSKPVEEGSWISSSLSKVASADVSLPSFNWIAGAKLPSGSQTAGGTVLPADAEPQPDGTVLIPGMPSVRWEEVTLPDGIRLDGFVDPSSTAPESQGKMPDGSKPVKEGRCISSLLSKVSSADTSLPSFNWIVGTKLPAGSQTADGTVLPAGSEPQPDGTVKIPGMPSIKWEQVTLPDGIRLDGFIKPSSTAPETQGKMPDGSQPLKAGSWIASLLRKPTVPVDLLSSQPGASWPSKPAASSPSEPENSVPSQPAASVPSKPAESWPAPSLESESESSASFYWIAGAKLPFGSQKADGTVLPADAEPLPDGTVKIPGMPSIKWEDVTLPDGIRLDNFVKPSGTTPETLGNMPDGSKPTDEGSWISSLLSMPATPEKSELPSFCWITGAKLPAGSQMADGSRLPANAVPQPDGTVLIPGKPSIKWEEVTLPDGIRLDGFVSPSNEAPKPQGKMPDGSEPAEEGSWIASLLSTASFPGVSLPTTDLKSSSEADEAHKTQSQPEDKSSGWSWPKFGKGKPSVPREPSLPEISVPSFNWTVGTKLPAGCKMPDGTVLPADAEPQPDGTVLIPGCPSIKWDQVTLPDGSRLDAIVKPAAEEANEDSKQSDSSRAKKRGWWWLKFWDRSRPDDSAPLFNWILGAKLPPGSQTSDGTVLPADAVPQPDGTVLIPGMPSIEWAEVTLPDGIRLDAVVKQSEETPKPAGKMPDGSKPVEAGSWTWSMLSKPSLSDGSLPSFNWILGAALPAGSQTADGTVLPANSKPQPDGTVKIPGMPSIKWEEATLPDGIRLDALVSPSSGGELPQPAARMPDGSQPAPEGSWSWSVLSKPSMPDVSAPSFNWPVNQKLPDGCQMPDGTVITSGALPQPDGTVSIPGKPSIKWQEVTLPDGIRLDAIVKPSAAGEAPQPAAKMPDGSAPAVEGSWSFPMLNELSSPDVSLPSFNWTPGTKLPAGCQMPDGTVLPADSEPQPDGSVKIPGKPSIKWEEVTLPDGFKLDAVVTQTQSSTTAKPSLKMPDGSKPAKDGGWRWPKFGKPSVPEVSFNWTAGQKLPAGCQMPDGSVLPSGSEPQSDGTVKIPGMPSIKWEEVTLPDGFKLDAVVTQSGATAKPSLKMIDGSEPTGEASWPVPAGALADAAASVKGAISGGDVSVPASTLPAFDWSAELQLPEGCQFSDGLPIPLGAVPLPDGSVKVPGEMPVRWHDVVLPDGVNLDWLLTRPATEEPQPTATMPDGTAPVALGAWSWLASGKPSVPGLAFAGGAGSALAKGAAGVAGVGTGGGGGAGESSGGSGGGGSGGGSGSGASGGSADDGSAPLGAPWLLLLLFLGAAAAYPTIRYVRQKGDKSVEAAVKGDTSNQNAWEAFKGFVLGGLTAGSAAIGSAGGRAEDGFKGMQQSFGDFINGLGIGAGAKKHDSTTTGSVAAAGAAAAKPADQQASPPAEEDSAPGIVGGVAQFLQQATGTAAEDASASSTAGKGSKESSRGKGWWLYPLLITAVGVAAYIVVKKVSGGDDSSSAAAAAGAASGPAGGGRTIYKPPVPNPATSQSTGQTASGSTQPSGSRTDVAAALGAAAGGAVASGATSQGSSVPGATNVPTKGPSGSSGDTPPPGYPSAGSTGAAAAAATSQMPAESDLKAPEGTRDLPAPATDASAPGTTRTGGNLTPEPTSGTPGSAAWVLPSPNPSREGQSSSSTTSTSAHGVWKYTWVGDGPAPAGGPGTLGPDGMATGWQCTWEGTGPAPKSGPGGDSAAGAVLYKREGSGPAPVGGPGGAASTTTSAYMYKWEGSGPPPPGGPGKPGPDGNIEGWSKVSWDGSGPMPAGFATPEMTTTKIMYKWDGAGPPPPGGPGKPGPDGSIEGWSKVSWDGSGPMPAGFNTAETTETKIMYKWEGSGPPPPGGPGAEAMSSAVMYKWVGSGPAPAAGPGEPGPDGTIPGWQKVAWDGSGPMPAGISGPEGLGSTIMYKWEGSGPMPAGGPAAGAYTWSSTSVQGSTASGTRQQGGLGRILNFIPGLGRKRSSTEGVASTSGVSGAASSSAGVSGSAANVRMVGSGSSTQAEGADVRSSGAKATVSKLPPWAPIPLFLAVTATWQAVTGKEEKDDKKTKEKGILGGVKLPFLRRKKQTKESSEVSATVAIPGTAASSGGGKSSWLGFKRNKAQAESSPKEGVTSEDGSWWWNPWMLTAVGVAAYIVIKKTSQDGGSGSASGAISAGAAAGLAGAAGPSTARQLKIPEDSEVLANCQPGDPEYDRLMKKLERIEMLEKTLRQEHAETDDVQAARRQISDMRQSLKRR